MWSLMLYGAWRLEGGSWVSWEERMLMWASIFYTHLLLSTETCSCVGEIIPRPRSAAPADEHGGNNCRCFCASKQTWNASTLLTLGDWRQALQFKMQHAVRFLDTRMLGDSACGVCDACFQDRDLWVVGGGGHLLWSLLQGSEGGAAVMNFVMNAAALVLLLKEV